MTETESVSDVLYAIFVLFAGYVVLRATGVLENVSPFQLALDFAGFAVVALLVLLAVGGLVSLLNE